MEKFFTNAFNNMDDEARESFYKTVFMNDDSEYAKTLRIEYYKTKFKKMGENVRIGKGVKIVNPEYISLGDGVIISDHCTLIARGPGGIEIGDYVFIHQRVFMDTETKDRGFIKIGNEAYIGTGTTLFGHVGLEIGEHALLAQNVTCTPCTHIYKDPDDFIINQGTTLRKVTIGKDAYIGMGVDIMYSGDIGEGSVVGSGAVVAKPIPPYSVAVGNPAKVIKERK